MNLVSIRSFEGVASPPWNLAGSAVIDSSQGAAHGEQALVLTSGGGPISGEGWQSVTLTTGLRPGPLKVWVRWTGDPNESLQLRLDPGDYSYVVLEDLETSAIPKNTWVERSLVAPISVGTAGRVSFLSDPGAPPHGFSPTIWAVDLVDLDDNVPAAEDVVQFRKWNVAKRLQEKLLNIRGPAAGYWTDIGDRVLFDLVYPHEDGAPAGGAYVCIPLTGTEPSGYTFEERGINPKWQQPFFAFVPNPTQDLADRSGRLHQMTLDLEDDLVRALTGDPQFGDLVSDTDLGPIVPFAGEDPEFRWGQVQGSVLFEAHIQRSNYGPGGD